MSAVAPYVVWRWAPLSWWFECVYKAMIAGKLYIYICILIYNSLVKIIFDKYIIV